MIALLLANYFSLLLLVPNHCYHDDSLYYACTHETRTHK